VVLVVLVALVALVAPAAKVAMDSVLQSAAGNSRATTGVAPTMDGPDNRFIHP